MISCPVKVELSIYGGKGIFARKIESKEILEISASIRSTPYDPLVKFILTIVVSHHYRKTLSDYASALFC